MKQALIMYSDFCLNRRNWDSVKGEGPLLFTKETKKTFSIEHELSQYKKHYLRIRIPNLRMFFKSNGPASCAGFPR